MSENQLDNQPSGQHQDYQPLSFRERISVWLPLLMAVMLGGGTWIGLQMRTQSRQSYVIVSDSEYKNKHAHGVGKVEEILRFVDARYLEGVALDELEDAAIEGLLNKLDPHSTYIPSTKLQGVKESLQGNFDGIGVEFFMLDDTILVVGVVPKGPSDKAGLKIGDRFLRVNDSLVAGKGLSSKDVVEKLKGEAGSKVNIQLRRRNQKNPILVSVERGQIPMNSVETAFMLDQKTGFIKISRFSGQTYEEFMKALEKMVDKGMKDLVIDLRHNPGGYLNEATDILNQLFNDKRLLVYTEGRSYKRKEYKSQGHCYFKIGKLALLIDEGSASASEIMAGAVQDNDRGLIVGRRSFGKGLVQEQYELSDASALRLTVARYFTPSGRLIQRSYKEGNAEYEDDIEKRYNSGELLYRDSIKVLDSTAYKTTGGRLVFGGGGIIPDIFVPVDTLTRNHYYALLNAQIAAFVYRYMDREHAKFETYKEVEAFVNNFQVDEALLNEFIQYALNKGKFERNEYAWQACKARVSLYIKAYIGQQLFRDEGFHRVLAKKDTDLIRAVQELNRSGNKLPEAMK